MRTIIQYLAILVPVALSFARTEVSGAVSGVWDADHSPYYVTGDLSVDDGTTLEVKRDVRVNFTGNFALTVRGTLIIEGKGGDDEEIRFAADKGYDGNWGGIRFLHASSQCKLRSFSVEDAAAHGAGERALGGAFYVENSDIEIMNCAISKCSANDGGGAIAIIHSNVTLTNTAIGDCQVNGERGIVFISGSDVSLTNIAIGENTGTGLYVEAKSDVNLVNAAISDNRGAESWGVICKASDLTMTNTAVSDNAAGGAHITDASKATITTSAFSGKNALKSDQNSDVTTTLCAID